jgi:glyceraldehyde 3-phosphate dehydrogenase
MQKIRVFINGFGRIGRSAFRVMLEDNAFEIVGINDIFPVSQFPYLMQFDSIYNELQHKITLEDDLLHVGGHTIRLFCQAEPEHLDLSSLHVDVLLQCTGLFLTKEANESYLHQGVGKIIFSAPPKDDIPIYIMGFNHQQYKGEKIISNSSCSTNAIAPLMQLIDKHYGISAACISMVHSYTGEQNLLDAKHPASELRRSRSATQNILPLESTATATLASLFPHLSNKIYTKSIRVPINATTLYDFTLYVGKPAAREELNDLFVETSHGVLRNIIGTDDTCKVSSDFIKNRHSATIDLPLTEVLDGRCIKITVWQDNEYGYAYQLVAMARHLFAGERTEAI